METTNLSELLHDLASINLDRAKAYEEASLQNHIFDVELRTTFALLANQSRQNNYMLNVHLEKLLAKNAGIRPASGPLYGQWKNDMRHFKGDNRKAMLDSCESGEMLMVTLYEKALEASVRPEMREVLQNQLRGMQSSLATVKKILELGGATSKSFGNRY
jgi:uncharacterized protein (TIGR02284 family)